MGLLLDIACDGHRVFAAELQRIGVCTVVKAKHTATVYYLDFATYEDYSKAKDAQIRLQDRYKDIPVV